jgi:hypothetical protein
MDFGIIGLEHGFSDFRPIRPKFQLRAGLVEVREIHLEHRGLIALGAGVPPFAGHFEKGTGLLPVRSLDSARKLRILIAKAMVCWRGCISGEFLGNVHE